MGLRHYKALLKGASHQNTVFRVANKAVLAYYLLDHPELKPASSRGVLPSTLCDGFVESKSLACNINASLQSSHDDVNELFTWNDARLNSDAYLPELHNDIQGMVLRIHSLQPNESEYSSITTSTTQAINQPLGLSTKIRSPKPRARDRHELFLAETPYPSGQKGKGTTRKPLGDVATIKIASTTMPLQRFLQWIKETHALAKLLPGGNQQDVVCSRKPLPSQSQDLYHQLAAMKSSYNPKSHLIKDRRTFEIIAAIYCELKWRLLVIDRRLKKIAKRNSDLPIRDFVAWTYDNFKITESGGLLGKVTTWNPRYFWRERWVLEEAIGHFEREDFMRSHSEISIYAKHIVCLLRGARDFRQIKGEELVCQHPSPAQMV